MSDKITFVIPSRNNLEFLKLAYKSIRDLKTKHEILILNDASTDGTQEWIESQNDTDLITYHNPGPGRIGIVGMFDKGIEMARTDIIMAFHADMVAAPNLDVNILKHLEPGVIVSATRVEPPLHPPGPEKITLPWGNEVEEYEYDECIPKFLELEMSNLDKTTEGIFAPWCMYKKDYLVVGGHDPIFAPQSKEDSDLFNRFTLNGYKTIQSWDGLVYHFTSRGSRFNKHAGGGAGKNSPEWERQNIRSAKEFIRKWGHFPKHDEYMKPIIPPKYDIGLKLLNPTFQLLGAFEPWFSVSHVDNIDNIVDHYIAAEQPNTSFDLHKRVHSIYGVDDDSPAMYHDIVVTIDGNKLTHTDLSYIENLAEIIKNTNETGTFKIGNLGIQVISLIENQNQLIICKKSESLAKDSLATQ